MFKKLVSLALSAIMVMGMGTTAFAMQHGNQIQPYNITDETIYMLEDIPIYITYIDTSVATDMQISAKEDSNQQLKNSEIRKSLASNPNMMSNGYKIVYISDEEKHGVISNPIFTSTFKRVQELIDGGTTVNHLNIFLPEASLLTSNVNSYDMDDPEYWEEICDPLGTYNGYKFLYLESSVAVESNTVTPGNLSGSLKWDAILKKTLTIFADRYVKGVFYDAVSAASGALSDLFSFYEPALSISYSPSTGYVEAEVSGDVYIRTVLIRDDLDRVDGHAYYDWGSTERFMSAVRIDAKYPYYKNPSGTYEYEYPSETLPTQRSYTPGYYGNSTLYQSIINLYTNTIGYFTHNENIDVNGVVASLLN